ncbi:MAG TPA: DUF4340 domain-containing protein [Gammaproteobacteria bacterium]|nr:DUF4340 domain-containing protein [Gammaproteobacteria bacterium]
MQRKALGIVLLLLVVPGGAWLMLGERQSPPDNGAAGQRLFPELEQKLNDITRIRVEHNGSVYEVLKHGDQWQLPDKGGYPVLFERVKPLLLGLALLEKVEPKTDKPENYARLGVQEPAVDSGNIRIELYVTGDDPVASLIVGGIRSGLIAGGRDGIYVRISGDPRAWLVSGNLDLPQQQVDWVDRQIIHIKPKTVQRVTIRYPDGDTLEIAKRHRGVATYTVVNMPGGAVLKDGIEINTLARGLAALNMDDVLVRAGAGLPEADAVAAVFETWDGLRVTAWTVEQGGEIFVWFDVGANAPVVTDLSRAGTTQVNDEVLRARLEGWVYRIPRARGDKLRKRLDDITVGQ